MTRRCVTSLAALLATAAALMLFVSGPANAALVEMDDAQLARVVGQSGAQDKPGLSPLPVIFGALNLDLMPVGGLQSGAEFQQQLAGLGIGSLPASFYDGRAVFHIALTSAPVDIHEDASSLLRAFGVDYNNPSLGSITINQLDVRGTSIWIWPR